MLIEKKISDARDKGRIYQNISWENDEIPKTLTPVYLFLYNENFQLCVI
jgi:hypothetical protein